MTDSQAKTVGTRLVALCNSGAAEQAVTELYADSIVSVEPGMEDANEAQQIVEGMPALLEKHAWWEENVEVHSATAIGPFLSGREHEFMVQFDLDATQVGGERSQMREVGLYTVADGKVVREEFFYLDADE